jgi:hypothetical protein
VVSSDYVGVGGDAGSAGYVRARWWNGGQPRVCGSFGQGEEGGRREETSLKELELTTSPPSK